MSRVTLKSPFGKGTLTVADDKAAERYSAAGWVKEGGSRQATTQELPEGDPSDAWTVPQLKTYAEGRQIDLGGATRKGDILAALNPSGDDSSDNGSDES